MKTRTQMRREFYEFLLADDISLESGIVNALLPKMIGVEFPEHHHCLDLGDYGDENVIKFSLPHLKFPDLKKVLDFLKFPINDYETNSSITLDSNYVLKNLVPNFKGYYSYLKKHDPNLLRQYSVSSKAILESTAIETLKTNIKKALDEVLSDSAAKTSANLEMINNLFSDPEIKHMIDTLLLLSATVQNLEKRPILYKEIINTSSTVATMLQSQTLRQFPEIIKQLDLVKEGIDLFTKYHRTESVLSCQSFMREIEQCLNQLKISGTQCNIMEEILLELSHAKLGSHGKCHSRVGGDPARLIFEFEDISQEQFNKILKYVQNKGDETAIEGYGFRPHGSSIPERQHAMLAMPDMDYAEQSFLAPAPKQIEKHSLEVDGKFFYEKIFPIIKAGLNDFLARHPNKAKHYHEASKAYLAEQAKKEPKRNAFLNLFKPTLSTHRDRMEVETPTPMAMVGC